MRPINQCLNPQLIKICKKSMQIEAINSLVKKELPQLLAENTEVAFYEKGIMILKSQEVYATELRFYLSSLRDRLRQEGLHQLISIKIKVEPPFQPLRINKTRKAAKPLSTEAKEKLKITRSLCQFPPLKIILERLLES